MPDFIVTKVPFWSAIITQTQYTVSVPAYSTVNVVIQPPSGETWFVWIDAFIDRGITSHVKYSDFDGTTARIHTDSANPGIRVLKILTNTLYARLTFYNDTTSARTAYYAYSGFKLSQPQWTPQRPDSATTKPFKLSTNLPLPDPIKPLDKYKALILGLDLSKPNDYALGIILEEDTPLAIDPNTGFPIERKSAYVKADVLADLVLKFRRGELDPVQAGYKEYLDKWESKGIKLI
ncbi:MAG: phage tail assembly chaperone [Desulfurococcaceae archaeon]|nr:phage tail assembly chaperone [Desulfurococcaceae archaeon]